MAKPLQIIVDRGQAGDPVSGQSAVSIPSLKGKDFYIEQEGYGTKKYSEYTVDIEGGFSLNNGATFPAEGVYTIHLVSSETSVADNTMTNGFHHAEVVTALSGRLGWRQPTLADAPVVDSINLASLGGRVYDGFHTLCNIVSIRDCQPNPQISDPALNDLLRSMDRDIMLRCLNAVFSETEIVEQDLMYDKHKYNSREIANAGNFAGYIIDIDSSFDLALKLDSLVFKFTANATFPIYLFKDGARSSVWSQLVTVEGGEESVIVPDESLIRYISSQRKGGRYYLGYFQDDIGAAKAIQEEVDRWGCFSYIRLRSFYSKASAGNFDRNALNMPSLPVGFNIEVSVIRDWTARITKNAHLFDELRGLVMAYKVIEDMIYTNRSNAGQRKALEGISMASLIQDLNGSAPVTDGPPPVMGLKQRIDREAARVKKSFFPTAQAFAICL